MRNLKKKGFTIVELVIVIAVIAVLAAVLIPTFVNLTKKANMSSDQVAVRNMNTLLAAEFADQKPTELKQVIDMLDKNGYNVDALTPLSKDYVFVWNIEENKIELVLESEVGEKTTLEDGKTFINKEVATTEELVAALQNGNDVTLTADIEVNDATTISGDVTIDMNGYKLDGSLVSNRPFSLSNGATLTINAEGSTIKCGAYGLINIPSGNSATVVLNGGTYTAETDNGGFVKPRGKGNIDITLNNVNYSDVSDDGYVINSKDYTGSDLKITVNGGNYKAAWGFEVKGNVEIKNAVIEGTQGFGIYGAGSKSTITVENSTIKAGSNNTSPNTTGNTAPANAVVAASNATVYVKNCTLKGNGDTDAAFGVYTSGGTIIAENNTVELEGFEFEVAKHYGNASYEETAIILIKVDGEVLADIKPEN